MLGRGRLRGISDLARPGQRVENLLEQRNRVRNSEYTGRTERERLSWSVLGSLTLSH